VSIQSEIEQLQAKRVRYRTIGYVCGLFALSAFVWFPTFISYWVGSQLGVLMFWLWLAALVCGFVFRSLAVQAREAVKLLELQLAARGLSPNLSPLQAKPLDPKITGAAWNSVSPATPVAAPAEAPAQAEPAASSTSSQATAPAAAPISALDGMMPLSAFGADPIQIQFEHYTQMRASSRKFAFIYGYISAGVWVLQSTVFSWITNQMIKSGNYQFMSLFSLLGILVPVCGIMAIRELSKALKARKMLASIELLRTQMAATAQVPAATAAEPAEAQEASKVKTNASAKTETVTPEPTIESRLAKARKTKS